MFSINSYIDAFQLTKKTLTDRIITDTQLNKAANKFIEAQTTFAKMLVQNTENITKYFIESQCNIWFPNKEIKK